MNKQEKNETAILNEEMMGGIKLPFFDSHKSFFAPSNFNTNSTFAPSYGMISQQLHQPSYLHYLSESPKKYSQISQSGSPQAVCHLPKPEKVIEPTSRLFEKMQATSSIPFVDSCHHQRAGSVELIHSKHPNLQSLLSSTSLVDNLNLDWKQVHEAEGILPIEVRNECSTPWIGTTVAHAPMKSAVAAASKQRIRWSRELHGQFVEAVNSLGGASKATPKEILKLMKSEALTISHIKSHLQKYRTSKHTPNFIGGKNKRSNHDGILQFNMQENGRLHILEALHLQKDVQKSLEEHLEYQRNQEIRIEEHAKLLRRKFDHKTSYNFSKNHNLDYSKDASSFIKQSTAGKGDNSENYLDKTDD